MLARKDIRTMDKRYEANRRVKKSIINALFDLMDSKNFSEITITEIVSKAGVARQSYYRNFDSKESIIEEFFDMFHKEILEEIKEKEIRSLGYDFVTALLSALLKYKSQILKLNQSNFTRFNLEMIDQYIEAAAGDMSSTSIDRYILYYFAGAIYNTAINWLENGAVESREEMAAAICKFKAESISDIDIQGQL